MTQKKSIPLTVVALVIFVLAFAAAFIISKIEPHIEDVNADYLKQHIDRRGFILVDARPEENYEGKSPRPGIPGGHIPGAISFPLEDLGIAAAPAAMAHVGIVKQNTIIVYCNTGVLSGWFADRLVRRFHFSPSRIKNYRGGVTDWVKEGNILLPEDHETGREQDDDSENFNESDMQRPK
ncbi:MAG: hypothetical protein IJT21_04740 [Synergistaceae bacterium]|nr:hypothetical protein [Synergistaceae bacterium]